MERLRPHYPSPNLSTNKDRTHECVCRKRCSLPPACAMTVHRDKTELSSLARLLCGFSDPREDRESEMQTGSDEGVIVHLCLKKLPERKGEADRSPLCHPGLVPVVTGITMRALEGTCRSGMWSPW